MKNPLLIVAAATLLAACAADPAARGVEEKVYATGSNIPKRERNVHTMTPEDFEHVRNSATANTVRKPGQ